MPCNIRDPFQPDFYLADKVGSGEFGLKGLVVGSDEEKGDVEVFTELPRFVL